MSENCSPSSSEFRSVITNTDYYTENDCNVAYMRNDANEETVDELFESIFTIIQEFYNKWKPCCSHSYKGERVITPKKSNNSTHNVDIAYVNQNSIRTDTKDVICDTKKRVEDSCFYNYEENYRCCKSVECIYDGFDEFLLNLEIFLQQLQSMSEYVNRKCKLKIFEGKPINGKEKIDVIDVGNVKNYDELSTVHTLLPEPKALLDVNLQQIFHSFLKQNSTKINCLNQSEQSTNCDHYIYTGDKYSRSTVCDIQLLSELWNSTSSTSNFNFEDTKDSISCTYSSLKNVQIPYYRISLLLQKMIEAQEVSIEFDTINNFCSVQNAAIEIIDEYDNDDDPGFRVREIMESDFIAELHLRLREYPEVDSIPYYPCFKLQDFTNKIVSRMPININDAKVFDKGNKSNEIQKDLTALPTFGCELSIEQELNDKDKFCESISDELSQGNSQNINIEQSLKRLRAETPYDEEAFEVHNNSDEFKCLSAICPPGVGIITNINTTYGESKFGSIFQSCPPNTIPNIDSSSNCENYKDNNSNGSHIYSQDSYNKAMFAYPASDDELTFAVVTPSVTSSSDQALLIVPEEPTDYSSIIPSNGNSYTTGTNVCCDRLIFEYKHLKSILLNSLPEVSRLLFSSDVTDDCDKIDEARYNDTYGFGDVDELQKRKLSLNVYELIYGNYPHSEDHLYPIKSTSRTIYGFEQYDEKEREVVLDCLNLKVVYERWRTGFEKRSELLILPRLVIGGRYEVVEEKGRTMFCTAIECIDLIDKCNGELGKNRRVCVKMIKNRKDLLDQSLDEIKILRHIQNYADVDDVHIIRLLDYFYHREHLMIVTELLEQNLHEFDKINKIKFHKSYFSLGRLQKIAYQLLVALKTVHSLHIIHCDIKPENILMKNSVKCEIKLIDFGSSCYESDSLSAYVQSRPYRAPEVLLGLPYDSKIDIWSLGCTLAELWTGYCLFTNNSIQSILAKIAGIFGNFPSYMIKKAKYSSKYFSMDGQLFVFYKTYSPKVSHDLWVDSDSEYVNNNSRGKANSRINMYSNDAVNNGYNQIGYQNNSLTYSSDHEHYFYKTYSTNNNSISNMNPDVMCSTTVTQPKNYKKLAILLPKKTNLFQRMRCDDIFFIDFLYCLMQIDPVKRLSAEQALQHPWLTKNRYIDGL